MTPTAPAASLVRSTLGSLSEGAAEQSEAEGVYFVGCCKPMVFPALCRGRQLGDPQLTQ